MNLNEQVGLITGGASGIGKHLVESLSGSLRALHVIDINAGALDKLATENPAIHTHVCDLTDFDAVQATVAAAFASELPPTVLINNAGMIHSEPLINLMSRDDRKHSLENWHRTIDINLNSVFYMTLCFADAMLQRRAKGVIVSISSITACGNAGQSAYAAAKAAVNAMTVTWAKELGIMGIRAASIAPGFMDTPSTNAALSEGQIKHIKKNTPLNRLGDVEEVASAVRFIIENDFFTGRVVELDGGIRI
jgi:3-oxoacyl-[acyl-carrier protein] reductase